MSSNDTDNQTIDNQQVPQSFSQFLAHAFSILNPGREFIKHWHIGLITDVLQEVELGHVKRLVVNIPPRSLKSTIISVAWPAWLLAVNPSNKIIVTSYSQALSIKHAQDTKMIMESDWYIHHYPKTIISKGKNTQRKFTTTMQGIRLAASVGSTLTGEGADFIIVDDPQTALQARSPAQSEKVKFWYNQTLLTRLNDTFKGRVIVVMQRLHEGDLTAHLHSKKGYAKLILPLHTTNSQQIKIGRIKAHRPADHILYEGWTQKELDALHKEFGSHTFAAQYQQDPNLSSCTMIKRDWIKRYQTLPNGLSVFQSWDCAIKIGYKNDYSVCTTWGIHQDHYYLMNVLRKRLEYSELRRCIVSCYEAYKPLAVLIEDKASGQQLLQEFHSTNVPVCAIMPEGSKEARLLRASVHIESGRVHYPVYATWLKDYEEELLRYPYIKHDDQIDSTTQFICWAVAQQEVVDSYPKVTVL
ncbi:MAG: phage terminase large subunit [Proteobacteria bacterium]|nr:phage terminase large subunit [Pseudomonadota bacterium]